MKEQWFDALISLSEGKPTNCPNCHGSQTHATFKHIRNNHGYIVVWCDNCKHGIHISRAKNNGDIPSNLDIPKDIVIE